MGEPIEIITITEKQLLEVLGIPKESRVTGVRIPFDYAGIIEFKVEHSPIPESHYGYLLTRRAYDKPIRGDKDASTNTKE